MARVLSTCREHTRCPVARIVEPCCRRELSRQRSAPSALPNCTHAANAPTSTPRAGSNVHSRSLSGFLGKMSAINVRSIPCACASKKKPRLRPQHGRWMPAKLSKIFSKSKREPYGFEVGRIKISLINDCGAWVTRAATACATSSGCSIFFGSFPVCGLKSVSTEPGQTTATRIL